MNVLVFICIGVEYLGTFCSILFGFRKCNTINYIVPGYLESVLKVPQAHSFSIFLKNKPHKTDASFRILIRQNNINIMLDKFPMDQKH